MKLVEATHRPSAGIWSCGRRSSPPWWSWAWSSDRRAALCGWWRRALAGCGLAAQTYRRHGTNQVYKEPIQYTINHRKPMKMKDFTLLTLFYVPLNNASSEAQELRERFLQNRTQKYIKQGAINQADKWAFMSTMWNKWSPQFDGTYKGGCKSSSTA